ncbi:hypothetical protein N1027_05185 [Herbiconiux sp. CPCC 205763]|uniref:DUF6745 domain-containing protein n=1 Tax=Herbiconiux aconitum TaxID=2970913 RepID=A0ABT2GPK4_9MICO|nr:hypothetical protein [Herbiconiux aconitum]MCS5717527.1 hypothetical protein [Herbiconiux aconitum]
MDLRSASMTIARACLPSAPWEPQRAEHGVGTLYARSGFGDVTIVWARSLLDGALIASQRYGVARSVSEDLAVRVAEIRGEPENDEDDGLTRAEVLLKAEVWDELWAPVFDALEEGLDEPAAEVLADAWTLAYEAGAEMRALVGRRSNDQSVISKSLIEIARQSCAAWFLDGVVVLAPHPRQLLRDDGGRPHAAEGPAIAWADGSEIAFWHGEHLSAGHLQEIGSAISGSESDDDVRRLVIERLGWGYWLDHTGSRPIATADDARRPGTMLELHDLPDVGDDDLRETSRALVWRDRGTMAAGVPHLYGELVPAEHGDPVAAVAELWGWTKEEYADIGAARHGDLQGALAILPIAEESGDGSALTVWSDFSIPKVTSRGRRHLLLSRGEVLFWAGPPITFEVGTIRVEPGASAELRHPHFPPVELGPGTYRLSRRKEWTGDWRVASGDPGSYAS